MTDATRKWLAEEAQGARHLAAQARARVKSHPINARVDAAALTEADKLDVRAADLEAIVAGREP